MTLAQLKANSTRKGADRTVNRWTVYKQLCIAKSQFSVNDRCLAVLYSLLSFYPTMKSARKPDLSYFHPIVRYLCARTACLNRRFAGICHL
ncbi:hypothetical protein HED63_26645 [Ochrobactrum cytisi]|nr:hypothetical protein [Brucella cytisi]